MVISFYKMILLWAFFFAGLVKSINLPYSETEKGSSGNQLNKDKDKDKNNNTIIIIVCSSVAALILLVLLIYIIWCCLKPCKGGEEVNTTPLLVSINMANKNQTIPERDPIKPLEARDDSEKFVDPAVEQNYNNQKSAQARQKEEEELHEPEVNEEPIVRERSLPPMEEEPVDPELPPQEENPQEAQQQPESQPQQQELQPPQPEPQPQQEEPQQESQTQPEEPQQQESQPQPEETTENHEGEENANQEGEAEEEYEDDPENPGQKRKKLEHHNRPKGEHMYLAPLPKRKKREGWTVEVEGTLLL
ncbi:GABA-A receptor epsilon, putative [Trichomonas vaginalis G3]|uniref:GABA-A receptor epsilon, putative n=1 Tax=Trichomonas vaginalis (strain ATCC PRA-98 / G3) TaxID=412133 RepID=A2E0T1_TRIV3|nr:hypothetical protein TVAGG3_0325500 [Trichomonas vaginalis G3]EAY13686.1 GABA-A receptor epsilon, putative [Trichomonas vaginalis G3]KAI5529596.1 hypothetical protein TVAGG3_0325500 [Trichomonas vaginalis G3]|eukprot:XP_001325909.1 GABA-A receptor epsilon [Trichomonas vaginalis G3]